MHAWRALLSPLLIVFMSVMTLNAKEAEVSQKARKPLSKAASSPIVGEADDSDAAVLLDQDNDEDDAAGPLLKSKEASDVKEEKSKNNNKKDKENGQIKKRDIKREKLMEGFREAEEFHNCWYNFPISRIKTSLEKLTKFCQASCLKKECMDKEVANNCHLVCPESTLRQCPDPLKESGDEEETEEIAPGDEGPLNDPIAFMDDSDMKVSDSPIENAIRQSDSELISDKEEGD